jgi:4,5-dihydroxyphthalate decarboxylase
MTLRLRAAFSANPRVAPLMEGAVRIPGLQLDWDTGSAGDLHERHLRDSAHDVFEFSISNYLVTRERLDDLWDWVMIPVYASKATLGINTLVNVDAGISEGRDLRGCRFGIPDYTMTAGLWFRAQLKELWDIDPGDITWVVGRQGEQSHGAQMGFEQRPPTGVRLEWSDPASVNRMLQEGELAAAFPAEDVPIDTSTGRVARLFPDRGREFFAQYAASAGFLPVNHVVLVQRRLVEAEPWIAEALLEAFEVSKQEAYRRDRRARGVFRDANDDVDAQVAVFGEDPFPYGVTANLDMLRVASRQSHLDGLTTQEQDLTRWVAECVSDS